MVLWKLVRRQLAHRPRRLISVLVTVVIGVGFTAACITYNATAKASLAHQVAGIGRTADVLIVPAPEVPAKTLLAVSGVAAVESSLSGSTAYRTDAAKGYASIAGVPSPSLRWFTLSAGTWPDDRQVVVDQDFATSAGLRLGSTLTLAGAGTSDQQLTVAGMVAGGGLGGADVFAPPALVQKIPGVNPDLVAVSVADGVDPAQVVAALRAVVPSGGAGGSEVLTGAQFAAERVTAVTDGSDLLGTLLLGFAAIALLVGGIVIANVFTILTTARRRELALLRCIGATSGQVTGQVVLEGLAVGALGSIVGVLAGYGAAAALTTQLGSAQGGVVADVAGLLIALLAGIVITTGAAAFPAIRTGRVAPLAALQPISPEASTRRVGILRVVSGLVLTLGGAGGLLYAASTGSFALALGTAAVSAIGVLLLTRAALPLVMRALGPVARLAGIPGRLATANALRTPGRAAATSAALLVGVALIVTLQVGAASAGATLDRELSQRFPVPLAVTDTRGTALPSSVLQAARVAGLDPGEVRGARLRATAPAGGSLTELLGDGPALVIAPSAQALGAAGTTVPDGVVEVPDWWADSGVRNDSRIAFSTGAGRVDLQVRTGHLGDAAGASALVVNSAVLQRLSPGAPVVAIWAAVPAGVDAATADGALRRATSSMPAVEVGGSAAERAMNEDALGTVLTIATALLAVAVLIALVGIASTLALSVLERTRESALLRALGLQRSQLRRMISVEALLLAAVGALTGAALGIGYGLAGSSSVTAEIGRDVVWQVPWGQILLVIGAALVAGLLASALPARTATRVSPAAALAEQG